MKNLWHLIFKSLSLLDSCTNAKPKKNNKLRLGILYSSCISEIIQRSNHQPAVPSQTKHILPICTSSRWRWNSNSTGGATSRSWSIFVTTLPLASFRVQPGRTPAWGPRNQLVPKLKKNQGNPHSGASILYFDIEALAQPGRPYLWSPRSGHRADHGRTTWCGPAPDPTVHGWRTEPKG